ncbi:MULTISPECIES: hypothetical protein [Marinobacter]|jgi:hypothetical protein|uniref:hypothetical protein n=1 Tax=Marinobacter TaxID=2742 RepID=UPI00273B4396|nr:hypothetical protein [Marinobacter salarius]MDP4531722.1 hypothetical protein [Marinobacter salarius]WOI20949.1 hypothetical protein R1T46_08830 [Marinobacter salarius]
MTNLKTKAALLCAAMLTDLLLTGHALADSEQRTAIESGAVQLSSEEIEALVVGNTVRAKAGEKIFNFFYGTDNVISGELVGGNWSGTGYYGVTDQDSVCLSMAQDKGRLRCMTIMKQNGAFRKYSATGKLTFELLEVRTGNQL